MNISLLNAFGTVHIVLCAVGGVLLLSLILMFCIVPMKTWFIALFSNAHVSMAKLISLKSRKIKPMDVVNPYIMSRKAKLKLKFRDIEAFYLAGGDCVRAITSLSLAKNANLNVTFDQIKSLELSGQATNEILDSVIRPKIIQFNANGIAKDNIEIITKVKATVQANIDNIVGGFGEDTIIARIQSFITASIGSSEDNKYILSAPNNLVEGILDAKLDEGCSLSLKSVEICGVDLGRDIGAEMATKNSQRDIALAQIEAERMKNSAMIREQQMRAKAEEMKSVVLSAEAEVPKAIAEAVKEGRFSIMDYYKLMNLQADTAMRRSMIRDDSDGGE